MSEAQKSTATKAKKPKAKAKAKSNVQSTAPQAAEATKQVSAPKTNGAKPTEAPKAAAAKPSEAPKQASAPKANGAKPSEAPKAAAAKPSATPEASAPEVETTRAERVRVAPAAKAPTGGAERTLDQKLDAKLRTPICDLFGIDYPIVQTGMGWVSGAQLTAATSAAGGLGILAAATMTFEELEQAITRVKDTTDRNFGVNLRADQADVMKRVELLIDAKVKVASFAQAPGKAVIARLKEAGVLTMPTIGAQRHAQKVAEWGVDSVIAQGHEGGGHTGNVPTHILMRQVADVVSFPFLGAGGFSDGRGLVSAMASGASGIAMGTRFLLTQESQVPEHIKAQYVKTPIDGTVVTRAIDGYPQRVIRTPMIDELEQASPLTRFPKAARNALTLMKLTNTKLVDMMQEGRAMKESKGLTWSQLAMAANAPMLTKASMVDGRDSGILPTGQVVGVIDELPTVAELIRRIMAEAKVALAALQVD